MESFRAPHSLAVTHGGRGGAGRGAAGSCGRSGEAGFSLLEVLAALAILAVSHVALAGLFRSGLGLAGGARERLAAANLAVARLEELKALGVEGMLALEVDGRPYLLPPAEAGPGTMLLEETSLAQEGRVFTRRVTARWLEGGNPPRVPPATILHVTVSVAWEGRSRPRVFSLDTLLAKRGDL